MNFLAVYCSVAYAALIASFVPLYNDLLDVPLERVRTDMLFASFAHVNSSCELDFEFASERPKFQNLLLHNNDKTLISLGWGKDDIPSIEQCPGVFAASVARFVARYSLVGFDIDYEDPVFSSEAKFVEVSTAIRKALPRPLLLTITAATFFNVVIPTLNDLFDIVNVQSYWSDVVSFLDAGVLASKVMAGVDVESLEPFESAVRQVHMFKLMGVFVWKLEHNMTQLFRDLRRELES